MTPLNRPILLGPGTARPAIAGRPIVAGLRVMAAVPVVSSLAWLASACGGERAVAVVSRDSAGVTIVETILTDDDGLPRWTFSRPLVVVGGVEDEPGHQLREVIGAARLSDGSLLIGDGGSRELRVFDARGRHLRTFAGQGQGPGELPWLRALRLLRGDSVVVSAWPFGLLAWFDASGEYLRSGRIGPFRPGEIGLILADGSLLIDHYELGHGNNVEAWAAQGTEPTFRAEGWLVRVHADGSQDSIRPVRGVEWFKRGKWRQDLWLAPRPFAPKMAAVVAGPRVFVGDAGSGEIEVRSLDGALERLIRWSAAPVPVTAHDRAAVEEDALATLRQAARRDDLRRWLGEVPFPDSKPGFTALATDAAERLWVQLPTRAGEALDRWVVFTAGGEPVAEASPPAGSRLLEIGDDYAIALWRDALDVEHVRLHGLEKG